MKKLSINQARKSLDFNHEYQFIEYLNEVYLNGQFEALKRLYSELNKEAKKSVLINCNKKVSEYLIINCL